jgi:hypothetical protein
MKTDKKNQDVAQSLQTVVSVSVTASELRIGNKLVDKDNEFNQVIGIVNGAVFLKNKYEFVGCPVSWCKPINLTKEWLINLGFENWGNGKLYSNEFETYNRYVLHNVLEGTSNFEVHLIKSTYGNSNHYQYVISCDEDERINWGQEILYIHQLQNLYLALTGHELTEH